MNPTKTHRGRPAPDWDDRLYAISVFIIIVSSPWVIQWALAL
jgi:hypothetical protein